MTILLKSIVVYGANSSGKSNLLAAIDKMTNIVERSSKMNSTDKIGIAPFLLNTETLKKPSFFEILFLIDSVRYRYGFEVTDTDVHAEWLFMQEKNYDEQYLFIREKTELELSNMFEEGKGLEKRRNSNMLFLATVDQLGGKIANSIIGYLVDINTLSGVDYGWGRNEIKTILMSDNVKEKKDILSLLKSFDLGFEDIHIKRADDGFTHTRINKDGTSTIIPQYDLYTTHRIYDNTKTITGFVQFNTRKESAGTNKILDFIGDVFIALFHKNKTIIIDELDAKLHPILTNRMIQLFHSPKTNRMNSQFIFATHDTNLLSSGNLRRDQIYFTEKDNYGATDLYSLVEYKLPEGVCKDRSFEKDYIAGRYGAIPFLGNVNQLLDK